VEVAESMRSRVGVDERTLAAFAALFPQDMLAGAGGEVGDEEGGEEEVVTAAPLPAGSGEPADDATHLLAGVAEEMSLLQRAAAASGDADAPITGIDDLDTLIQLVLAKMRVSVAQGLADSYEHIYSMLDSAASGAVTLDDVASGVHEMGIEIPAHLLPGLMEHMAGRPGATTLSVTEFVAFCNISAAALHAPHPAGHADEDDAELPPPPPPVERAATSGGVHADAEGRPDGRGDGDDDDDGPAPGVGLVVGAAVDARALSAASHRAPSSRGGGGASDVDGGGGDDDASRVAALGDTLRAHMAAMLAADPELDYSGVYALLRGDSEGGLDAHGLEEVARTLGMDHTVDEYAAFIAATFGANHPGERPLYMRVQEAEFVQFCGGGGS
jgi:hypothetical protein